MQKVTVRVPGTSANLGPGYDCLGVALDLANEVTVRRRASTSGTGHPMVEKTAAAFFSRSGRDAFPFEWGIRGKVPQSRGLGSSVTVRLGLLLGLNALTSEPLDPISVFRLCSELEGHPDNAAPAQFGGFTVARPSGDFLRFEVDAALHFVLLIPEFETLTSEARRVLPRSLKHREAVDGMINACTVTAAFASRNYAALRGAFGDHFHQPFRTQLIPFLPQVIEAGVKAGALGGFLSGSGSTIACVTLEAPKRIATAMKKAAGARARTILAHADNVGAILV